jgi:hypothetical protein
LYIGLWLTDYTMGLYILQTSTNAKLCLQNSPASIYTS